MPDLSAAPSGPPVEPASNRATASAPSRVDVHAGRAQDRHCLFGAHEVGEVDAGLFHEGLAGAHQGRLVVDELHLDAPGDETPESRPDAERLLDDEVAQVVGEPVPIGREVPGRRRAVVTGDVDAVTTPPMANERDLHSHTPDSLAPRARVGTVPPAIHAVVDVDPAGSGIDVPVTDGAADRGAR